MILMGISDEAGVDLPEQLAATRDLDWKWIEMRVTQLPGSVRANFHDIPEAAFDDAVRLLETAGVRVYCFGSAIMNWAKKVSDPFDVTVDEVKRCLPRLKRLGTKYVRIMSYKPGDDEYVTPPEVFRRVREVTQRFLDEGIQPIHENCMNYAGMSWKHTLELLDKCPGLKLLFDPANPVFNPDRSKPKPWPRQDPWEFWTNVREHSVHIHIKDAAWDHAAGKETYHWPGEGQGKVREILRDAFARGYDAALSTESHMVSVFHDPNAKVGNDGAARRNFVEYGQRLTRMVAELRPAVQKSS